jgi:hypothetical protein
VSYRAGVGMGLRSLGMEPGDPIITCDYVGCDARIVIDGLAPTWFLDGKAKRGWTLIRDNGRRDYCPQHSPAEAVRGTTKEGDR